jgi:hypothetical protein
MAQPLGTVAAMSNVEAAQTQLSLLVMLIAYDTLAPAGVHTVDWGVIATDGLACVHVAGGNATLTVVAAVSTDSGVIVKDEAGSTNVSPAERAASSHDVVPGVMSSNALLLASPSLT